MRLSLCLDPGRSWPQVLELARRADSAGWHAVYVPDHFMPHDPAGLAADCPVLKCWTVLTSLAAQTAQVRLGSLVPGNTYRHPTVVANTAATLDQVSEGRLVLGIGAGWQPNEHVAYGIALPGFGCWWAAPAWMLKSKTMLENANHYMTWPGHHHLGQVMNCSAGRSACSASSISEYTSKNS